MGEAQTYSIALLSDPHLRLGVDARIQTYRETVRRVNEWNATFVVINGDLVETGTTDNFALFVNETRGIQAPVYLVMGNHDMSRRQEEQVHNFFAAQSQLEQQQSGLYYAFDHGDWHFIILPTVESLMAFENNTRRMLQWLKEDLNSNSQRPCALFVHHHYMPQGLTQLEFYAESIAFRKQLLRVSLRYGNVRYWFAGHVHIGVKASVKTMWRYRGCTFITLPTMVAPRSYYEEYESMENGLFRGGYFLRVQVEGKEFTSIVAYQVDSNATIEYPLNNETIKRFRPHRSDPRWWYCMKDMSTKNSAIVNGNFDDNVKGWIKTSRYRTDARKRRMFHVAHDPIAKALRLGVTSRTGLDSGAWRSDELIEVYQLVNIDASVPLYLHLDYQIERLAAKGGGYVRLHAYSNGAAGEHLSTLVAYFGHSVTREDAVKNIGRVFAYTATCKKDDLRTLVSSGSIRFVSIDATLNIWHSLQLNLTDTLFASIRGAIGDKEEQSMFKLAVILGVWANVKETWQTRAMFDNVRLDEKMTFTHHPWLLFSQKPNITKRPTSQ